MICSRINATAFVAVLCEPACNEDQPCIRKCCPPDSVLNLRGDSICVPAQNPWKPYLYDEELRPIPRSGDIAPHYVVGIPDCQLSLTDLRKETKEKYVHVLSPSSSLLSIIITSSTHINAIVVRLSGYICVLLQQALIIVI